MINGFRKEFMFYSRGGRLAITIIVMLVLAVMSPLMFGMMGSMMESMKEFMPEDDPSTAAMREVFNFSASDMVMYTVDYVGSLGAIIILFLFKGAAGGEQKKRSVIIPQCAGLTAEQYTLPKFLIYPPVIFTITFVSIFAGSGVSALMFPGELDWSMVLISAVCSGVFLAFITALQFCVGICTGSANLAIIIAIVMQMFLPGILGFFRVDRFNPFALLSIALQSAAGSGSSENSFLSTVGTTGISNDVTALNIGVSIGTAIIISILMYFTTLFVLHSKEVHNEGNEPVL